MNFETHPHRSAWPCARCLREERRDAVGVGLLVFVAIAAVVFLTGLALLHGKGVVP
ncbi:MAG TPA: hypothetical protein VE987_12970 [Polyangiaceae bacterium]|nr:hypothetical protein [Polyangiaceae bacterium]